jgi:hypothetical protein
MINSPRSGWRTKRFSVWSSGFKLGVPGGAIPIAAGSPADFPGMSVFSIQRFAHS